MVKSKESDVYIPLDGNLSKWGLFYKHGLSVLIWKKLTRAKDQDSREETFISSEGITDLSIP